MDAAKSIQATSLYALTFSSNPMTNTPSVPAPAPTPLSTQPAQLELFRLVSNDAYANAFDFYESIPRFMVARGRTSAVTWNPDGTAAPLRREFTYRGKRYRVTIAPAYIDQDDGRLRAEFPGIKEEVMELVLTKLAMDKGYFTAHRDGEPSSDSFVLFTSLHEIAEELKSRGADRDKSKTYSYDQIREALHVLAKTKIHLRAEDDDDDLVFSPISDF